MRIFIILVLSIGPGQASSLLESPGLKRMALIIGNNIGIPGEPSLRHAVRDAEAVEQVFRNGGAFEKDRIYLLENPKPSEVLGALREMEGRVKELRKTGNHVLAVVYYSGHGGPDALHVGGAGRRSAARIF